MVDQEVENPAASYVFLSCSAAGFSDLPGRGRLSKGEREAGRSILIFLVLIARLLSPLVDNRPMESRAVVRFSLCFLSLAPSSTIICTQDQRSRSSGWVQMVVEGARERKKTKDKENLLTARDLFKGEPGHKARRGGHTVASVCFLCTARSPTGAPHVHP